MVLIVILTVIWVVVTEGSAEGGSGGSTVDGYCMDHGGDNFCDS